MNALWLGSRLRLMLEGARPSPQAVCGKASRRGRMGTGRRANRHFLIEGFTERSRIVATAGRKHRSVVPERERGATAAPCSAVAR